MKDRRNRDFLRACRRVISESPVALTAAQVARAASTSPAPEFYVTFGHAFKVISYMRLHKVKMPRQGNRAIYADLNDRAESVMRRRGCSLSDALAIVLAAGNAPGFYLKPSTAAFLYSKLLNRRREARHATSRQLSLFN